MKRPESHGKPLITLLRKLYAGMKKLINLTNTVDTSNGDLKILASILEAGDSNETQIISKTIPTDTPKNQWTYIETTAGTLPKKAVKLRIEFEYGWEGVVYADSISVKYGTTVFSIDNSGFEDGLAGWSYSLSGGAMISTVTSEHYEGSRSLKLDTTTGGSISAWHDEPITPGELINVYDSQRMLFKDFNVDWNVDEDPVASQVV